MLKMIKILQMGMTDNLGGIETYLINYYRNIDKNKIQFDFTNIYPNKLCFQDEMESMGAKIYKVSSYYKHPIKYIKEVKRIIKENNYNIVHCNMNSAAMLYPLIAAKFAGARVIIAHSHNASSDKGFVKMLLHNINKHFIPLFATDYVGCSKLAGSWFFSKRIINSDKFKVINNAIDVDNFKFNKELRIKKRNELGFNDDEIVLGHVGRFNKQKNQMFLVDLLNYIVSKNKKYKLILIGIGPLQENVKSRVKELNLENNVIFLNKRNDVNELMMAMDVFVLPSLYEGLPLVGIEAQTTGVPCLFSDSITNEVILNDNSKMISLKATKEEWNNNIKKISLLRINREKMCEYSKKYEITNNASELIKYYYKKNKIKLCHFTNGLLNGGVEKVIINYFSNMKNKDDYDLHIISQGDTDLKCVKEFEDLGFTIHMVTKKKISLFKNYKDIRNILKKEKFDIVHCHMTTTNFFPLLYSKLSGVKVRISHSHLDNSVIPFMERVYIRLTRLVSKIRFACSKSASTYLFGKNKNVTIINNAINVDNFKYNEKIRKDIRKELKISEDKIVIGHVGRFVDQKNHAFIIDLFKELSKDNDKYELLLIGTGELEDFIKEKVKKYNLSNRVKFLGTRNDVNELMQAFDIFILPSKFEGLGIVLIEAQVSGLKCFASSNIPEEVKVTNNIKLLDLDIDLWKKEINKVKDFKREDKSNEISKHGFDIKIESNKLDSIYKELLNKK